MFASGLVKANLEQYRDQLVIPRSAVLWTGKRSIVYVKQPGVDEPVFRIRTIELGPMLGNSYVVADGLADGEEIVTEGAFSVDAAAQLEGKPSMMNTEQGSVSSGKQYSEKVSVKNTVVEAQFKVSGNCDMCRERIESSAKSVTGVLKAEWNRTDKIIHIQLDPAKTNVEAIEKAIAKVGHDTERFRASDEVYKVLPECCLYRK
jgi:Cu(I)/Ag(I) efflux system membrane fusion protein